MADPDLMSPDATPGHTGVRRVNNMPLYLLGAGLLGFAGVVATVAYQRAAQQQQEHQQPDASAPRTTSALAMAKAIAGDTGRPIIEARADAPPPAPAASAAGEAIQVARPRPEDLDRPPLPPGRSTTGSGGGETSGSGASAQQRPVDQEAEQLRQVKLQQFMAAVRADTSVPFQMKGAPQGAAAGEAGAQAGAAPGTREEMLARLQQVQQAAAVAGEGQDPMAVYRARVAAIQGSPGGVQAAQPVPARNGMAQFDNRPGGDRWRLDAQVEPLESPYTLAPGDVIPVHLQVGINSELPGQIKAMVTRNVYDTATGKHLLIPQGTNVIGAYSSEVSYGQALVLAGWQLLNFPDGSHMDIGAMPGADPEGYAGLHDRVNNHYVRLFGSAFLMSGITAGIAYSQRGVQDAYGRPTFSGAMSEAVGQQLGQATAMLLAKNLNLSPTLEVRPGFRFTVVVVKRMTFPVSYQGTVARSTQ